MNKQEIWELIRDYGAGKYYGRLRELNKKITNEMYHYADWVITGDEEE
jgi:hypothetical protein